MVPKKRLSLSPLPAKANAAALAAATAAALLACLSPAIAVPKAAAKPAIKSAPEKIDGDFLKPHRLITLEEAYDRALSTDQSIRIAYYEIRKANLLPWSALARLGPSVTGNSSYLANRRYTKNGSTGLLDGGTIRADADTRSAGLTLEQPIFDLTVFPAYHNGKLAAKSARLQYRLTIRETLFGVAQAYYEVLKQQSFVAVGQQTVALANDQLAQAQNRFDVGQVAPIDVSRARASLEDARNSLIQSQGALESSRDTLSNILNMGGKTDFVLAEPPNAPDPETPVEEALKRAYAGREDFQISTIGVEQEVTRRREIAAGYGPRITAQASSQWTSGSGSSSGRTRVNSGVINVQIPFLTGGQREIDLRTAGHQISESKLNLENTEKSIESDVKNAWIKVRTGREALVALKASVEASTQNYSDLQSQYEAGAATSLDVQVALRELNNSRMLLTNQVFDYQIALRDLQRAQALFEASRVQKKSKLP